MSSKGKENEPNTTSTVSRSGHLWQVCDSEDKPYMLMMHRAGHHLWLRDDGTVQIKAIKHPADNENSGRLQVHCEGDAIIKLGNDVNIEVARNATLEVDGSIDVQVYKDINVRCEGNFNLNTGKNLTLTADQALAMNSKSKIVQTAPKATLAASMTDTTVTGPQEDKILGERVIGMTDPRGTFTLMSLGHMVTVVKGDHEKTIGGRESEKIVGIPPVPPLPTIPPGSPAKTTIIGASGGLGRVEKIMTGNDVTTVVVGNKITNVAAGNNIMTAAAGSVTIAAGVNATVTATANVTIAGASIFLN